MTLTYKNVIIKREVRAAPSYIYQYTHKIIHIKKGSEPMNQEIQIIESHNSITAAAIDEALYLKWVNFIDAKPKTIATYKGALKQFFIYLAERGIVNPQREDIAAFRDYMLETHKATTAQNYLTAVKLFFQWTAQEGIYPNIGERVKGVKIDKGHKKDYLTSRQAGRLLNSVNTSTLQGKRDYAILCLMLTTGLRTVSIIRANIRDLSTAGDCTVLFHQGKGRDDRAEYVKLAEPVEEAIRDYLTARGEAEEGEPLFAAISNRNKGGRMTTRSVSRIAKDNLIEAGFKSDRLTAHSLRHTAATLNLLNGGTVQETQQLLGHSSINTTLIYSHALERAKNNSENRIAGAIFK